jgi:hypothetical protein
MSNVKDLMLFLFRDCPTAAAAGIFLCALGHLRASPVEIIPPELGGATQPHVATSPEGHVHVVFGRDTSIYYTAPSASGRSFARPVRVADLPKLALGMRRGPRVSATDKVIVVSATSHADGNLHAWTSVDRGATWKESPIVNDIPNSAPEGLHAMVGDGKGFVFATWLDFRNRRVELWSSTSRDGGLAWNRNTLVYKSPDGNVCECCQPSAAIDSEGRVAVMWRNSLGGSRDLYMSVSVDSGKTFSPAEKLGSGTWKVNACPMDGGSIAFGPGGKLITVWRREGDIFASEGRGQEQRLASSAAQPLVVAGRGGIYFLWESDGALMLKKGALSAVRFAEQARFASVAMGPANRGPILVWESTVKGNRTLLSEILE